MKKIIILFIQFILLCVVLISCSSIPEPVVLGKSEEYFKREGINKTPEVWEDGIRTDPTQAAFEWWYFDAHLDDGTKAVIVFYTKPLIGFDDKLNPVVSSRISFPDGTEHNIEKAFPPEQFSASKEMCDVTIGNNKISGDLNQYHIYTQIEGTICDLTLKRLVPSWRPGVGKWYFGDEQKDFFAWFPSVPYGEISGTITYKGKTRKVKGSGYHDHNWGNIAMSELWNNWWWSRSQLGDYTNMAIELITTKKYGNIKFPIFMLSTKDEILFDDDSKMILNRFDIVKHPESDKNIENRLEFIYLDGDDNITVTIDKKKEILAYELLQTFPFWKRSIASIIGVNPWYFRFSGDVQLDLNINGVEENYTNETLYELMFLGNPLR